MQLSVLTLPLCKATRFSHEQLASRYRETAAQPPAPAKYNDTIWDMTLSFTSPNTAFFSPINRCAMFNQMSLRPACWQWQGHRDGLHAICLSPLSA